MMTSVADGLQRERLSDLPGECTLEGASDLEYRRAYVW